MSVQIRDHTQQAGGKPDHAWQETDAYFTTHLLKNNPWHDKLEAAYEHSIKQGLDDIAVSAAQGKYLALQIKLTKATHVLEVGTLGAYSTIWMCAAGPNVKVTSIEIDPKAKTIAEENIRRAGLSDRVEILLGNALEVLPRVVDDVKAGRRPVFDFAFIDADKESNLEYFNHALDMIKPGSAIIVDNVGRRGRIVDEHAVRTDSRIQGVRRMVEAIGNDERVESTVVQTVGEKGYDGFLLASVPPTRVIYLIANMVLLTSSTVSVIVSSGVACTFTLALFLSGYVLQQKTVRSLQEAIRNPIPKAQYGPTPILPPQFQVQEERNVSEYIEGNPLVHITGIGGDHSIGDRSQRVLDDSTDEPSTQQLWDAYIAQNLPGGTSISLSDADFAPTIQPITTHESLAYLLIINVPSDLCSALLFTKTQKRNTRLTPSPKIVFLYPATWETSVETSHTVAMDMLRESQEGYSITLHPVTISRIWASVEVESQLLADIQLTRWTYDRAMFVRPGGMIIDTWKMDQVLALSDVSDSWRSLPPTYRTNSRPELLMYINGLGLRAPTQSVKGAVAHVTVNSVATADMKNAAYVIMDSRLGGALSQRFDRESREICAGTGLLDSESTILAGPR